jgi:hypothetical protein
MINAKDELLHSFSNFTDLAKAVAKDEIKCASIVYGRSYYGDDLKKIDLKVDYSEQDFESFLNQLDFEYDNGYGGQELEGIVWLRDETWLSRGEYDGSEWWNHNRVPAIPEFLINNNKNI